MFNMVEEKNKVKELLKALRSEKYTEGEDAIFIKKLQDFVNKFDVDLQSYKLKGERVANNLFRLYNKLMVSSHLLENGLKSAYKALENDDTSLKDFESYLKENTRAYEYVDLMDKILKILQRYAINLSSSTGNVGDEDKPGLCVFQKDLTYKSSSIKEKYAAIDELLDIETGILSCYARILFDFHRLGLEYRSAYRSEGEWGFKYKRPFDPSDVIDIGIDHFWDVSKVSKALNGFNVYVNTMDLYYRGIYKLGEVLGYGKIESGRTRSNHTKVMRNVAENHIITAFATSLYNRYDEPNRGLKVAGHREEFTEGERSYSGCYGDLLGTYLDSTLLIIRNILIRSDHDTCLICRTIDELRANNESSISSKTMMGYYTLIQSLIHTFELKKLRRMGFYTIDVLEHVLKDVFMRIRMF